MTTDDKHVHASADRIWEWFTKEVFLIHPLNQNKSLATLSTWNDTGLNVDEQTELLVVGDGTAAETTNEINVGGAAEVAKTNAVTAEAFELEYASQGVEDAVHAASGADAAIVFVGNHPLINGKETMDRPDITLPASQEKLVLEVLKANPNTIVVVVGSYPFALNELQAKVPAILYTSHAGQDLGRVVAEVLFGDVNPAGRLNMTWYSSVEQLPPFMDYDIIQGGRTYQYFEGTPLYPFGHGLSYSAFHYEALRMSANQIELGQDTTVDISVRLTNTSSRIGEEVVQLYVRAGASRVKRPFQQLADFQRVSLLPGETTEVTFRLPLESLRIWDVTRERFCVESGEYALIAGSSSADLRLQEQLTVIAETIPPRDLNSLTRAVNYDAYHGVVIGECVEGGSSTEVIENTGWLLFADSSLEEGINVMELRAASAENAMIEVRLDAQDGPLIGKCDISAGARQEWRDFSFELIPTSGRHDVYLVLRGSISLSWFRMMK